MLHLETCVHLHEVVLVCVCVENELHCPCIHVAHCLCSSDSRLAHLITKCLRDTGRCLFYDLLVPSLYSAVALVQVKIVTVGIAKYLHLNMARSFYILLNEHVVIAKTLHAFSLGGVQLVNELRLSADNPHAFTTASEDSLEQDWETDLSSLGQQVLRVLVIPVVALQYRHACSYHDLFRFTLGPHFTNGISWWPNEG